MDIIGKHKILVLSLALLIPLSVLSIVFKPWQRIVISVDENNLPKFIQANFIDLTSIRRISKFRSGAGHDYSDFYESCRSMKHYFDPTVDITKWHNPTPGSPAKPFINIYSPVSGTVTSMFAEQFPIGMQIHIVPESAPAYTVILFHVYPEPGIHTGSVLTAGEKIGHIGSDQQTDIAVKVLTIRGPKNISYFSVMSDSVFAEYAKRGIASREALVITKSARDASPLTCNGEMFSSNEFNPADWVSLN